MGTRALTHAQSTDGICAATGLASPTLAHCCNAQAGHVGRPTLRAISVGSGEATIVQNVQTCHVI